MVEYAHGEQGEARRFSLVEVHPEAACAFWGGRGIAAAGSDAYLAVVAWRVAGFVASDTPVRYLLSDQKSDSSPSILMIYKVAVTAIVELSSPSNQPLTQNDSSKRLRPHCILTLEADRLAATRTLASFVQNLNESDLVWSYTCARK
jgi:hypothetical protein